jgi:hypothetical protein
MAGRYRLRHDLASRSPSIGTARSAPIRSASRLIGEYQSTSVPNTSNTNACTVTMIDRSSSRPRRPRL